MFRRIELLDFTKLVGLPIQSIGGGRRERVHKLPNIVEADECVGKASHSYLHVSDQQPHVHLVVLFEGLQKLECFPIHVQLM